MKDLTLKQALALLETCPIGILLTNADGAIHGCNRSFAGLVGESAESLAGDTQADGFLAPLLGQATLINWIMPDGDSRWLAVETYEIHDEPGCNARFFFDVTEKLRLREERDALARELEAHSLYDTAVNSLLSRYGMLFLLRPLVARSRRYNSPLSLVSIRASGSTDNHAAQTRMLHLLKDQTRWADLVGCNDERDFILILQETTQDAAEQMVRKITTYLEHSNADTDNPLQACYGITQYQKNDDETSILERAESALAHACHSPNGTVIAL